jgi:hypothetical protein
MARESPIVVEHVSKLTSSCTDDAGHSACMKLTQV